MAELHRQRDPCRLSPLFSAELAEPAKAVLKDRLFRASTMSLRRWKRRIICSAVVSVWPTPNLFTVLRWARFFAIDLQRWPAVAAFMARIGDARRCGPRLDIETATVAALTPNTGDHPMPPMSLLDHAGIRPQPAALSESVLVLIDMQREYSDGRLALPGVGPAVAAAAELLARARRLGTPVIHVLQQGRAGWAVRCRRSHCRPDRRLAPAAGEGVVKKTLPNAFAGTDLAERIAAAGRGKLVVIGFMTHMCVDATTRLGARPRGWRPPWSPPPAPAATCRTRSAARGRRPRCIARRSPPWADRFATVVAMGPVSRTDGLSCRAGRDQARTEPGGCHGPRPCMSIPPPR